MRPPELRISLDPKELVLDYFAGGGGASTGVEQALGRHIDIAVNHDAEAIAMHKANHPETFHMIEDVFEADIPRIIRTKFQKRRVGLAWFSPDCTYHSIARGGKPHRDRNKARRVRGLAWVVIKCAKTLRPRVIAMENVSEFHKWGPLLSNGQPCPDRRGVTYRYWRKQLENLGYTVDERNLAACDYGAGTTRKRLFIIARCDGVPIVWPEATHAEKGYGGRQPYVTAADGINFDIECPSIFDRDRPLAEATQRRIAEGIKRFVIESAQPFIVGVGGRAAQTPPRSVDEPHRTTTSKADAALIVPVLVGAGGPARAGEPQPVDKPIGTILSKNDRCVVAPHLVRVMHTDKSGTVRAAHSVEAPIPTISGQHEFAVVAPHLVRVAHGEQDASGKKRGKGAHAANAPLPTQTASPEFALVAPTLIQTGYGEDKKRNGGKGQAPRSLDLKKPLGTAVAGGVKHAVVSAFLAKHYGGVVGHQPDQPLGAITTIDHHSVVEASLIAKLRGGGVRHGQPVDEPLHTITAGGTHYAEVRAFLIKFYKNGGQWGRLNDPLATITSHDRLGLVTVEGQEYMIVDIGLRMLTPRELFNCQGFPKDYRIEIDVNGRKLSKREQVAKCGNSVSPPVARAIIEAQFSATQEQMRLIA